MPLPFHMKEPYRSSVTPSLIATDTFVVNSCSFGARTESLALAEGRYVTSLNLTECELT